MGDISQWQFPKNVAGKVVGWSDTGQELVNRDVQAYSANLDEYAAVNPTTAGLALLDDADAEAQRTTLGLGSAATAGFLDEDDLSSDSDTAAPSQQSVKAFVNAKNVVDRTALLALSVAAHPVAFLRESGREGQFAWGGSDLSSYIVGSAITSTAVDSGTETVTSAGHGLQTGQAVIATTAVNGLSLNTLYYAIRVDANDFRLASSPIDAVNGTAFNLTGTTNFDVRRHYDPSQAMYVTPSADLSGATGAWVRSHSGRISAAWAGAAGDNSTDNSLAFLSLFGLNERFNWKIEFGPGLFRCAARMYSVGGFPDVEGAGPGVSGTALIFTGGSGLVISHSGRHKTFAVRNLAWLATTEETSTGINYTNAIASGGRGNPRCIENVFFGGYDYWIDEGVTTSGKTQGWLVAVDTTEAEALYMENCDWVGAYANVGGWAKSTFGLKIKAGTQANLTNCRAWSFKTAWYIDGASEGVRFIGVGAAGCDRGIDFMPDDSPANEIIVRDSHFNCYTVGVNIAGGASVAGTLYHIISGCFFLKNASSTVSAYKHIILNAGRSHVTNNTFDHGSIDAVASGDIAIDVASTGSGQIISANTFCLQNVCVALGASTAKIIVAGNTTVDNGTTIAVAPYTDAGTNNVFASNVGDRISLWPSPRIPYKSVTALNAEAKTGGKIAVCTNETGGATLVFAEGTNWRRAQDRAIIS